MAEVLHQFCRSFVQFPLAFFFFCASFTEEELPTLGQKTGIGTEKLDGMMDVPGSSVTDKLCERERNKYTKTKKKEAVKNLINSYALNFNQAPGSEKVKA